MSVMSIRTNVSSLNAQRNLYGTQSQLDSALSKLSTGYRITRASDDAAGLGVAANLHSQIKSYNQAVRNAEDGLSVSQVAEGALNETHSILSRMRELAMQSASDGVSDTERAYVNEEITSLQSEIDRIANATEFNGTSLLNTAGTQLDFQVGIRNVSANDRISVTTIDATASTLGVDSAAIDLTTKAGAQSALDVIDGAIDTVSSARSTFGAVSNRFSSAINTIQSASENLSAAHSRIRDVNVAEQTAAMSRSQVLMQAGVATLAQANQLPQMALRLLG